MTRIELTTRDHKCAVEVERDDLNIDELIEQLLEPVLLAAGYHPDTVKEAFGGD